MNQSTPTPAPNSRSSVEGPSAAAPALAYANPQPRLPHSEASPPEQPETFMRRARRVKLGSHRLKLWYLSLCTFGRAWARGEDVLEIGIKQRSLAGELETGLNRVSKVLAELRSTGLVDVSRSKYHSVIRIFLTPQSWPATPETGVAEKPRPLPDTPETGVARTAPAMPADHRDTPETGVAERPRSLPDTPETGVARTAPAMPADHRDTPETGVAERPRSLPDTPETGVARTAPAMPADHRDTPETEVARNPDTPKTGVASTPEPGVSKGSRSVLDVQQQQQHTGSRAPTEKQLSGITSMATELGVPIPEPPDRLAADMVFRELRGQVEAHRRRRQGKRRNNGPERPHVIQYSRIDRQSRCRVCGAWNPNPRSECEGA